MCCIVKLKASSNTQDQEIQEQEIATDMRKKQEKIAHGNWPDQVESEYGIQNKNYIEIALRNIVRPDWPSPNVIKCQHFHEKLFFMFYMAWYKRLRIFAVQLHTNHI